MKQIRRGKTVAVIGAYDGKPCTLEIKEFASINLAKKANGLNSRKIGDKEKFPPTQNDYMMAEIPEAV